MDELRTRNGDRAAYVSNSLAIHLVMIKRI
jgi:hypothetical protein